MARVETNVTCCLSKPPEHAVSLGDDVVLTVKRYSANLHR